MVAQPDQATMTVEEYLALEETSEVKHEYIHGRVYAMSGGTIAHDRIANTVRSVIDAHLGDGPCIVNGPDVRLRISPTVYYYPDAIVTCDEDVGDEDVEITAPRLIVEVLSESTEAHDRGGKWTDYQTLDSLEEYVLVESRRRSVERYRRAEQNRWTYQRYDADATVTLETINLSLPVATLYRRTNL